MVQEVHLLNTHHFGVHQIAQSTDVILQVTFSKDSKLIVVLSCEKPTLRQAGFGLPMFVQNQLYQIYSCSGLHMASFTGISQSCAPPLVHLFGSRVAIADQTIFRVWKLDPGQLLGTADTGECWVAGGRQALIATNSACSKLLYSANNSDAVHVYNAESLELMSMLLPQPGCRSKALTSRLSDNNANLIWGVYGWLLSQNVHCPSGDTRPVEMLQSQAGGTSYGVTSLGQADTVLERLTLSSFSPCGAYFCRFDKGTSQIQITDVRSAETVLRRILMPATCASFEAIICWSSCSSRLVVLVVACGDEMSEQLFVLQFC